MIKAQDKKRSFYICIFLAALTFVVYLRVLGNDFIIYDDGGYVTENPHTQAGFTCTSIKWAFTTNYTGCWQPMTWLTHMADCELFGLKPWGHHLVNLIFHIANVLLLFLVLKAMTGTVWRSAFVAVVFAVHPLNVESVAWTAERKNVLSTLFWFLTIAAYVRYMRGKSIKWYLTTILLFGLGLMSKPMLVTLPFVLLLLDYWPLERLKSLKDWKTFGMLVIEKIPFFVLSGVFSIVTFMVQKSVGAVVKIDEVPLSIRLANAIISYGKYVTKGFWPNRLAVFYPIMNNILLWEIIVSVAVLCAVSIFIIKFARNKKYLLVGWFWYLGTLIPVIGIVQAGAQAMADRYAYVPLIGLFIMVGWGVWDLSGKLVRRRLILGIAASVAIVALSIVTCIQAGYWRESITLFERTLAVTERDNGTICCNLGAAYIEKGEYGKAKRLFEQAISIKPNLAEAYNNLGIIYGKLNYLQDAIYAYNQAIKIKPDYTEAHNGLGIVYDKLGNFRDAAEAFKQAVKLNPDYAEAHYNLGVAYYNLGSYMDAIEAYKQAIRINPDYYKAHNNIAVMYGMLGRYQEKIEACKQAIRIRPNDANTHFNLGLAYVYIGNKQAAMEEYKILRGLNAQMAQRLLADINK